MSKANFRTKRLTHTQLQLIEDAAKAFEAAHQFLVESLPEGRYKENCIKALEESAMWANKCISFDADKDR